MVAPFYYFLVCCWFYYVLADIWSWLSTKNYQKSDPFILSILWKRAVLCLCRLMKTHTTPTEVKAATMLIRVGIMSNFPAFKEKMWWATMPRCRKCSKKHTNNLKWTHISINQHIESDGVGFQQSAILSSVLHLKILCVPKDKDLDMLADTVSINFEWFGAFL